MHRSVTRTIGMVLVALALAAHPGVVLAAPAITVSPDPAPLGTRVGFRGAGFPADTMLTLTVATGATPQQALIAIPVPTDDDGNFGVGFTAPANGKFAPGRYTVTVAGPGGKDPLATADFSLTGAAGATSAAPAVGGAGGATPSTPDTNDGGRRILLVGIAVAMAIIALVLAAVSAARRARPRGMER